MLDFDAITKGSGYGLARRVHAFLRQSKGH